MLKKRISLFFLVIFSLISWGIWIIEVNPFFTNSWNWTYEYKITFILVPLIFIIWEYIFKISKKIYFAFYNFIIFCFFFPVILCLIIISHLAGPSGCVILFSPLRFLLYKPVSLIIISILTFCFNFLILKVNKIEIKKKELILIYVSFFLIPIAMFLISILFTILRANEYIPGFWGFNNMDSILWFKSGIIIPVVFLYEGLLLIIKRDKASLINNIDNDENEIHQK